MAKEFTKREGVDFNEVFSPVVKYSSIRLLLAPSAYYDLELEQMDVKTTCLLKKSLYRLKQSSR